MTCAFRQHGETMRSAIVAGALLLAACAPRPAANAADSGATGSASAVPLPATPAAPAVPSGSAAEAAGDTGSIARLEREARALAHTEGCSTSDECRVAPLGHRACGGPRAYLAYCATTTDSVALFRALEALAAAEEEHQRKAGIGSTCEFRAPPVVTASAGRCVGGEGRP
jgi:hypothetical protein